MLSIPRWTLISNHALILNYIFHNPTSTKREISKHVGITERTTYKIIADLVVEGYVIRRKSGRNNVYQIDPNLPLRHHTKEEIMVSELIKALTAKSTDRVGA